MSPYPRKVAVMLAVACAISPAPWSWAGNAEQARRIYDRLAGVPPTAAALSSMQAQIAANNYVAAANIAMQDPAFYNAKLKNWITPWTNRDGNVFAPLNDFTATVIGLIRDADDPQAPQDFRQVLYGDVIYVGAGAGIAPYSNSGNQHYVDLENSNANLGDAARLVRATQSAVTGLPASATAGVMTTRAAARAFLIDGTNRALFRYTLKNMLCHDLETVLDTTRPADRIRQDVTRSPGNDSRIFLNNCIGCHSGMDPMIQAFAYYNFSYDKAAANSDAAKDAGRLDYHAGVVDPKYYHDEQNFKPGYHTPDDGWSNYWRLGPNATIFGWSGSAGPDGLTYGNGAKSMGQELAHSDAFAECQVRKVFKVVCLRDPSEGDRNASVHGVGGYDGMLANFKSNGNLKRTFAEAAAYCAGG